MYGLDFSGPQVVKNNEVMPLLSHPEVAPVIIIIVPNAHMSKKRLEYDKTRMTNLLK